MRGVCGSDENFLMFVLVVTITLGFKTIEGWVPLITFYWADQNLRIK